MHSSRRLPTRAAAALLVTLAAVSLAGCQTPADEELAAADVNAVRAVVAAYFDAANAGDAAAWAALYTEDAVIMPPESPVVEGRGAIEAWLEMLPVITDAEGAALEVQGTGSLAYLRGTYSMNLVIPGVREAVSQRGKFLQIYARQTDGSWRLARDIWNADPSPAGPQ